MDQIFQTLRAHAKHFGGSLAQKAFERGLAVTKADGSMVAIPLTATPVVLENTALQSRAALSAKLASAGFKMAQALLNSSQRELILGALSPLEKAILQTTHHDVSMLATTRVDFFVNQQNECQALELNATIPAMQGYSDIAAECLIESVGAYAKLSGAELERLKKLNGSNARALYEALQSGHQQQRGRLAETIALLCRRNDAQISELKYLCERFRTFGVTAEVVFPDELTGEPVIEARGMKIDILYRHLFVRRLEEKNFAGAEFVQKLLSTVPKTGTVILNPPISQAEVKTTFAFLSLALRDSTWATAARLSVEELEAIEQAVPWTRPFRDGPVIDSQERSHRDLVDFVASEPDRFVLKRAWDYGGRAVFIGAMANTPAFNERVLAAYGRTASWKELCQICAQDRTGGGFVVQERVELHPELHLLCEGRTQRDIELYVDFSAYASVGLDVQPKWGGVCRGSSSQIVNIVGGGGVLPLLRAEVASALHEALRDQAPDLG